MDCILLSFPLSCNKSMFCKDPLTNKSDSDVEDNNVIDKSDALLFSDLESLEKFSSYGSICCRKYS